MLFSEIKCKDIINIRDCKRIGKVCDIEFDECKGCICKLIVSKGIHMFDFFKCEPELVICFRDIKQIGPDIILVDINV